KARLSWSASSAPRCWVCPAWRCSPSGGKRRAGSPGSDPVGWAIFYRSPLLRGGRFQPRHEDGLLETPRRRGQRHAGAKARDPARRHRSDLRAQLAQPGNDHLLAAQGLGQLPEVLGPVEVQGPGRLTRVYLLGVVVEFVRPVAGADGEPLAGVAEDPADLDL